MPQCRDHGVRHRDRATVPCLGVLPSQAPGGPSHVRSGSRIDPGSTGAALGDRDAHQVVPGRVELDLVDAVAVPVDDLEFGLEVVGVFGPTLSLFTSRELTQAPYVGLSPAGALAVQPLNQGNIGRRIVRCVRWRLVSDIVSRIRARATRTFDAGRHKTSITESRQP
jgi:hypothetical protein